MNPLTRATLKRWAYAVGEPVLQRASRAYVPGPRLEDAVSWARQRAPSGCSFTFGYFNADGECAAQVERACHQSVLALASLNTPPARPETHRPGYCSVKVPALGYEPGALQRLALLAGAHGQRLHFDSHGPETAEPTLAALAALAAVAALGDLADMSDPSASSTLTRSDAPPALQGVPPRHPRLGLSLPGRWARSLADADWAAQRGLRVRVVKGQWPCPDRPDTDPRQGFLAVIDRLAGRVSEVAVATHDAALAREAARRLIARGTACELELLCGLPRRGVMALARTQGLPVRLYVPFGQGWLPYALGQVLRQPKLWPRLLKDTLADALGDKLAQRPAVR
jgi:proline dehydrogenase